MLEYAPLYIANVFTSILTAMTGVGGGTVLIGLMPLFLPAAAIIPLHGVTQLASNSSRAWFSRSLLEFIYLRPFVIGAVCGAVVFGGLVRLISLELIPLFIGIYILLTQWSGTFNRLMKGVENFYVIGFLQMGMVLFVGAAGPMHMPLLLKKYPDPHVAIGVASVMMSLLHSAKIGVYLWLGFSFVGFYGVAVMLVVAAIFGSWLGVRLRRYISADWLKKVLPWLLTIIAIKIIVDKAVQFGWMTLSWWG